MEDAPHPLHRLLMGGVEAHAAYKAWAKYDSSTKTLTFYYTEKGTLGIKEYELNTGWQIPSWNIYYCNEEMTKVVFDKSFAAARPTTCNSWFLKCTELTTIEGIENLNTSEVTNMATMFWGCSKLTTLDLTKFDTKNVTNMGGMFKGSSNLQNIFVGKAFVLKDGLEGDDMFTGCTSLKGDIAYSASKTDKTYATTNGGYFRAPIPWVKYADGTLTFQQGAKLSLGTNEYALNSGTNDPGWKSANPNVKKVVFDSSFAEVRPVTCKNWFADCSQLTQDNIVGLGNFNTSEVKSMQDMFVKCSKLTSLDLSSFNTDNCEEMQGMFNQCSSLKSLNLSSFNTSNVNNMSYMFYGCSALESLDLTKFNTAKVTSMAYMFHNCSALKSLNLLGFNTEKVKDMNHLFYGCSSLESLDLSHFNTANVEGMPSMFNGATKLTTLNVSSFNTTKVNNMGHLFANCSSLTSLDLSSFNTKGVEYVDNIFKNCSNLTTIYASANFAFGSGLKNSANMFLGCTKLQGAIPFDASKVDKTYAKLDGGYFTDKGGATRPWVKLVDGTLTFYYGYKPTLGEKEFGMNADCNRVWDDVRTEIKKVVFDKTFAFARPTTCDGWFKLCRNLTTIEGFENLNTSSVKYMNSMFWCCSALTTLDLSHFDTKNVVNMSSMFDECYSLGSLDLSMFDTRNVSNMYRMFFRCSSLTHIYVSDKFVLKEGCKGTDMFKRCEKLVGDIAYDEGKVNESYAKIIGGYFSDKVYSRPWVKYADGTLSFQYGYKKTLGDKEYQLNTDSNKPEWYSENPNVKKVVIENTFTCVRPTSCYYWFYDCSQLTSENVVGINNLNTSEAKSLHYMFVNCSKLTTLDLSSFNTEKCEQMQAMFNQCTELNSLNISNFKTDNVKNTYYMFSGCRALTTLDLYTFNTAKVENMSYMFYGCSNLRTIYASDKFTTAKATGHQNMFGGCTSLMGLIAFDANKVDKTYAKVDGGYFIDKLCTSPWVKFADGTLTFYYGYKSTMGDKEYRMNANCERAWYDVRGDIKKVVFDKSFARVRPTICDYWFQDCTNLTSFEGLENFNTSSVTSMHMMFYNCSQLTSLDLTTFDTRNVGYTSNMFRDCSNLQTIYVSDQFVIKEGCKGYYMFTGCKKLVGDITYSVYRTDESYAKVDGGYFSDKIYTRPWGTFADGTLTFRYGYKKTLGTNEYLLNEGSDEPQWYVEYGAHSGSNSEISKVEFEKSFSVARPTSCYKWFYGMNRIDNIEGIEYLNTSAVTNMNGMFGLCGSLTTLNLTNFDTQKVTDMSGMFAAAENLQTIYASDQFILSDGINSLRMFDGCKKLKGDITYDANYVDKTYAKVEGGYFTDALDLPRPWVKYADGTLTFLYGAHQMLGEEEYSLNEDNVFPEWYTKHQNSSEKVTDITKVVFDESFAQARPTTCFCWFPGFVNLKTIEGIENLNTSKVTNMMSMFWDCPALTSLDLSHFDTKNVEIMSQVFIYCSSLTSLDLSSFDTSKADNLDALFYGCTALQTIYVGEKFSTDKVSSYYEIFEDCPAIVYSVPNQYEATKASKVFEGRTVKPYVRINPNMEYGTLCVPLGSSLAEGSYAGFDKLYRVKNANLGKTAIVMEEATSMVPGVPYVYHRNLEGVDMDNDYVGGSAANIITFDVDDSNVADAPANDGSLLKGTFENVMAKSDSYILQSDGIFHPVADGNTTMQVNAYSAYLDLSSLGDGGEDGKLYRMVFDGDEATGIHGVYDQTDQQPKVFFDLMGRKVSVPQKGQIYILDGKKVAYQ